MKKLVIELENVSKKFKNLTAVNSLNAKIYQGEYIALLGPNGAGKTTLVEMIEGVQKADEGKISILGYTWEKNPKEIKERLGFSFQETKLIDKLTVFETLNLFASFYKKQNRVQYSMDATNLDSKKNTFTVNLSGGQRQRLALAIALLHEPEILILDEPTTGLDPTARREIWAVLSEFKKKGLTLILTTHYMEEAEFLCDRILIMDQGSFLAEGTLETLLKKQKMGELISFRLKNAKTNFSISKFSGLKNFSYNEKERSGILEVQDIVKALPIFLESIKKQKLQLENLECRKMTLDDLFLNLTGRRLDA